uniref:Putative ovule protein n=1 Tax=Solanum chacoense TaxID=4108 RepID=A0A0V0GS23_SOLCH
MTYPMHFLQNYGGSSGYLQTHFGVHLCGTNTVRKPNPIMAKSLGGSHIWRKVVHIREEEEHNIGGKYKDRFLKFLV